MRPTNVLLVLTTAFWLTTAVVGSPQLRTVWSAAFPASPDVVLQTEQAVLLSSQTVSQGVYTNTVQALNASSSAALWTIQSSGQVSTFTTAAAFSSVPKLVFLLENNLEPINVTAVDPTTGTVAGSNAVPFPTVAAVNLLASNDGRTLYFLTGSPDDSSQLTAFDSATGDVLFSNGNNISSFTPVQCGNISSSCIALFEPSNLTSLAFYDGRTGVLIATVTAELLGGAAFIHQEGDQLLLLSLTNVITVNTTSFTLAWTAPVPSGSEVQSVANVVVAMSTSGLSGFNSRTGSTLWNSPAKVLCPFAPPAPGFAASVEDYGFGGLPSGFGGGKLLSFIATCQYPTSSRFGIIGAVSTVDGSVKWWRYAPNAIFSPFPITPVGNDYLMFRSGSKLEFYNPSWTSVATYPNFVNYELFSATVVGATVLTNGFNEAGYPNNYVLQAVTINN